MSDRTEQVLSKLRAVTEQLGRASAAEEMAAAILEAAPDALVIVDHTGVIVLVNQQVEMLTHYDRDSLIGRPIELLVPKETRDAHRNHRQGYMLHPEPRPMAQGRVLQVKRHDDVLIDVQIALSSVRIAGQVFVIAALRREGSGGG